MQLHPTSSSYPSGSSANFPLTSDSKGNQSEVRRLIRPSAEIFIYLTEAHQIKIRPRIEIETVGEIKLRAVIKTNAGRKTNFLKKNPLQTKREEEEQ